MKVVLNGVKEERDHAQNRRGIHWGAASTLALILLLGAGGEVTSPSGTAPDRYVYYPGTEEHPTEPYQR